MNKRAFVRLIFQGCYDPESLQDQKGIRERLRAQTMLSEARLIIPSNGPIPLAPTTQFIDRAQAHEPSWALLLCRRRRPNSQWIVGPRGVYKPVRGLNQPLFWENGRIGENRPSIGLSIFA